MPRFKYVYAATHALLKSQASYILIPKHLDPKKSNHLHSDVFRNHIVIQDYVTTEHGTSDHLIAQ